MRQRLNRKFFFLATAIFLLFTLPFSLTSSLKNRFVSLVSFSTSPPSTEHLVLENYFLQKQLEIAQELLLQQLELLNEKETFHIITQEEFAELDLHSQEIAFLLPLKLKAVSAEVLFRSPQSWNSTLWINRGENDNKKLGRAAIQKNSPVVSGTSLLGIVEEVHPSKSKVRLLTDPHLSPAVRASRGGELFAKGELHGSALTQWRARGTLLKGEGFNYDFDDEYGPARDLRSQDPPLLKVGDLLVTSGMDGVFPAGLEVATVTKISPLREGDYYYEIEAIPTAPNLEETKVVYVLPALN